jgi:hypothetical protein
LDRSRIAVVKSHPVHHDEGSLLRWKSAESDGGLRVHDAEQMGHTVDVNENVYTITSINRRKEAVNALERALEA